jgi:hypothetical protein
MLAGMLLAVIPLAWLAVLTLFAALCRAASYGDVDRGPSRPRDC